MFEAHLYEAQGLRLVFAAFEHVCGSSSHVIARVKCCDRGIFWQASNKEHGSRVEFGFDASSFVEFRCTKQVSFGLKYMPLLLSQMRKANDDDRVIFKLADEDSASRGKGLFLIELETPSGISRKINMEMTLEEEGTFVPIMDTRWKSCFFSVPSIEVVKLGEERGIRFGFKCTDDGVFFTNDGVSLVRVKTCAAVAYPPGYTTNAVNSGAYHRRNMDIVATVATLCPAVNFYAEMNGTALFVECPLLPKEQDEFVTGYISIFCCVRVIE